MGRIVDLLVLVGKFGNYSNSRPRYGEPESIKAHTEVHVLKLGLELC